MQYTFKTTPKYHQSQPQKTGTGTSAYQATVNAVGEKEAEKFWTTCKRSTQYNNEMRFFRPISMLIAVITCEEEPATSFPMIDTGEGAPQYTFDVPTDAQLSLF